MFVPCSCALEMVLSRNHSKYQFYYQNKNLEKSHVKFSEKRHTSSLTFHAFFFNSRKKFRTFFFCSLSYYSELGGKKKQFLTTIDLSYFTHKISLVKFRSFFATVQGIVMASGGITKRKRNYRGTFRHLVEYYWSQEFTE